MPTSYPVDISNINWTPVTVGAALLLVLGGWYLPWCRVWQCHHGKARTLGCACAVSHPTLVPLALHVSGKILAFAG